ncbi:MAG: hypothetical protein ACLSV2_15740 [Clostridium sp.]
MICRVIKKNDTEAYVELLNGYIKKVPASSLPENSSIGHLISIDDLVPIYRPCSNMANFI